VGSYARREPEKTVLFEVVNHLHSFARDARADGRGLPSFARAELERYLGCGILANGFARARCAGCGFERLVAFSCKGRGVCPSCGARRMAETAALLADELLPRVAYRQWVLTVPHRVRYLLARQPELVTLVLGCFLRVVQGHLRRRAPRAGFSGGAAGAVTFVQRFGDALNLHVHFHALLPDGVWTEADGALDFRPVSAPMDGEVERACATVGRRVTRLLQRRGLLEGEDEAPDVLASLQAKAILAALVRHQPGEPEFQLKRRCAALDGYSVHANTAIAANDREGLERLCRYGTRPSLSLERMRRLDDGNIGYRLKRVIGQSGELVLTPNVHLPAWMRPPRPPAEARPRAWEELAEVESNVSELPRWMQPAPVPQPRQRQATDDLAFRDEVDPAQLPTWVRAGAPPPYSQRPFDRPAPEEGSQVPPQWGEDVDALPGEEADLDPVVDLGACCGMTS
jgi:hypothetical protein